MFRAIFADDDEALREAWASILSQRYGFVVDPVSDGRLLVEKFRARRYDLVVTDYDMGTGMDGIMVVQAIRVFDREVPIVLMSASNVGSLARDAGATEYIPKGLDVFAHMDEFLKRLGLERRV